MTAYRRCDGLPRAAVAVLRCAAPIVMLAAGIAWLTASASAQTPDVGQDVQADRFTQHNWSQIYPDFDFLTGCVNGYLAFVFSDNGSFVFNHRVRGSWRVDGQGNISLRTRDGVRFKLLFNGSSLTSNTKTTYFKRFARFAECE
jgi:hypothetical protein